MYVIPNLCIIHYIAVQVNLLFSFFSLSFFQDPAKKLAALKEKTGNYSAKQVDTILEVCFTLIFIINYLLGIVS